jgi:5-oxopent-3-ene-1,2,5-tricarboxylate decarboxylase/2-hydroxyhepta-2,4-diene-1,7-dioate isomerase
MTATSAACRWPSELSGCVYTAILNQRSAVAALGASISAAPYGAAPNAPVLFIKPRNTLCCGGDDVLVPAEVTELEINACLGVVIGRTACRVSAARAFEHIAGYVIVNDVGVPHASYYRPPMRHKARDGFCPVGAFSAASSAIDPDSVGLRIFVDDRLMLSASTRDAVRPVARLLEDVSEFMTLAPGDVLATGAAVPAPRVRAGQSVTIEADGLESLSNRFVAARA